MPIFTTDIDADGIATIAWDLPGKSMNVLTDEGIADLDAAVTAALADPAVRGIVITSAKPDFAAGMDLNVLASMKERAGDTPAAGIFDGIMAMHRLLRKIERAGLVVVPGYLIPVRLLIFVTRNRGYGLNEDWLRTR
jgi:3-hydroxyacyl-CoA dehydrogenase/enoyl-CoA hydratase/3-hydroxybutyryl-CoA epimerase